MRSSRLLLACLLSSFTGLLPLSARAQLVPDQTLGNEASVVISDVEVRGAIAELIEGGATREQTLFHSFSEFNIFEGQRVYFASPVGVESILSRVTGNNPSNLFGTLGVDGIADLFFLNPNGIVFGQQANLDIEGSFYATTVESIEPGEDIFSTVESNGVQLLTIHPNTSFLNHLTASSGDIISRGSLNAGRNLALAANNLNLQGKVISGDNITLLAGESLEIRDGAEEPFIAFAGSDLWLQGNQQIDIFALTHPESILFSGQDMHLRSTQRVRGDAHYFSQGSFRIETLEGIPGNLYSPVDPVIRVMGDLTFQNYLGNSLHILAGGSVVIPGTIAILGADTIANTLSERVVLSDGSVIQIDGAQIPTLDIRAGVDPTQLDISGDFEQIGDGILPIEPSRSSAPTSAGIVLGNVIIAPPEGQVFISNNYFPDLELPNFGGDASLPVSNILILGEAGDGFPRPNTEPDIQGIDARGLQGNGSNVVIDSRNDIWLSRGASVTSSASLNNSGDIKLLAEGEIWLAGQNIQSSNSSSILAGSTDGQGGNVELIAGDRILLSNFTDVLTNNGGNLSIETSQLRMENFSNIGSSVDNEKGGGNLLITAFDSVLINGGNIATFDATSVVSPDDSQAVRTTGNIVINTADLDIVGTSLFVGEVIPGGFLTGGDISSEVRGNASAGEIELNADNISLSNGAQVRTSTFGAGRAGDITFQVSDSIDIDGVDIDPNFFSGVSSNVSSPTATGVGGTIHFIARDLNVTNGGQISASTSGVGDAGGILLDVSETTFFDGVSAANSNMPSGAFSSVRSGARGNGGNVQIFTSDLIISNQAQLFAGSFGEGNAGEMQLDISNRIQMNNGRIATNSDRTSGGEIMISAADIRLEEDSDIETLVQIGLGTGGNILINADSLIAFEDSDILAFAAEGRGGNITLNTPAFFGEEFQQTSQRLSREELLSLDGNNRVDINATGAITSGTISLPDVSFVENNLTELTDTLINPEVAVASSCITNHNSVTGTLVFTGGDRLPQSPNTSLPNAYTTDDVQPISTETAMAAMPISEPQAIYHLPDGRLLMNRPCQESRTLN